MRRELEPETSPSGVQPRARGPIQPAGVEVPDLDRALDLLKRLNDFRDPSGRRLAARVTIEGFEPWWFLQERVFWHVLVPYVRNRASLDAARSAGPVRVGELGSEIAALCDQLRPQLAHSQLLSLKRSFGEQWLAALRGATTFAARLALSFLTLCAVMLFRLSRRDTVVYTIDMVTLGSDHDFRIASIYRELRSRGYRFGEYVHVRSARQAIVNLWRRRRPVVFFEAVCSLVEPLAPRFAIPSQPRAGRAEPDDAFLTVVAEAMLSWSQQASARVAVLKALLRLQGVRRAVILDDSRHANELIAACKALGTPTLGYMHGLLNRYHPGLMAYGFDEARRHTFDLYGLWSEYFRKRVLAGDLYRDGNTFVCGLLRRPDPAAASSPPRHGAAHEVCVLVTHEPRVPEEEVIPYVRRLLNNSRFRILYKTRPGQDATRAMQLLAASGKPVRLIQGGSAFDAIAMADVVLGTYSTVLYEAALLHRPAIVVQTSFAYGYDIVADGLAGYARSPDDVVDEVLRAAALPEEELVRRRRVIWGDSVTDGAAVLFDTAERVLWRATRG